MGRSPSFYQFNFEYQSGADGLPTHNSALTENLTYLNRYRNSGPTVVQRHVATIARAHSFRDNKHNIRRKMLQTESKNQKEQVQEIGWHSFRIGGGNSNFEFQTINHG